MDKIFKFGEYQKLQENREGSLPALFLIKKTGEVVEKRGNIIFDKGIFDEDNLNYLAAIGEDMQLYTTSTDTSSLFKFINTNMMNPDDFSDYTEGDETFNQ